METRTEGVKYDSQKPRTDLLPADALLSVAELYHKGAGKYGDRNWELGMSYNRMYGALLRHLFTWWNGEDLDQEEGHHHLDAVLFYALGLRAYTLRGVGTDNRPKALLSSE